jgi:hypothetical protein
MTMSREDVPKMVVGGLLLVFLIFLVVQIFNFSSRAREAKANYEAAKRSHDDRAAEHARLKAEVDYYSHPENFAKELKARFNYHVLGERTLILVPQKED